MLAAFKYLLIAFMFTGALSGGHNTVDWRFKVKQEVHRGAAAASFTETYTYDEQGRLIIDSSDKNMGVFRISYIGNIVRMISDDDATPHDIILDSKGREVQFKSAFIEAGVPVWRNVTLLYDAAGYCITNIAPGDTTHFVIAGGDHVLSYSHGDTIDRTYYYPQRDLVGNINQYEGRANTHLAHYRMTKRDDVIDTMTYNYIFDTLGRVTTKIYNMHGHETARMLVTYVK